jgi:hypothetical protein
MAQPTPYDVHVNAPLTNVSIAYIQSASNFIAGSVFPEISVDYQSNIYTVYTKNDWFRDEATVWAPGTESAGSGYNLDNTNTYFCTPYGFHKDISDQVRRNNRNNYNLDREATNFVTNTLLIRREVDWASEFFTTGKWTRDYTGVSGTPSTNEFKQWSDYTSSDPANDIRVGKMYVKSITGFTPNTLVLEEEVFEVLKLHPDLVDKFKYTSGASITTDMMAGFFGVDKIYIAGAVKATNTEGATGAYSFVMGKGALLCYVTPTPGLLTPSSGYSFVWKNAAGGMNTPSVVWKYRMDALHSERIEAELCVDHKIVGNDLGVFFTTAIA